MPPAAAARSAGVLLLALAGCQSAGPEVSGPVAGDPGVARSVLVAQAAQGPVPTTIIGDVGGLTGSERDQLVESALARGVRGAAVEFDTDVSAARDQPRVVVAFNPAGVYPSGTLCREPEAVATRPQAGPLTLAAAYCRGEEELLNAVEATAGDTGERATRRLLWRTAAELFPDDYADTYGLDVLPGWLDLGVEGSFGF